MQYITPKDDTSTLSLPERFFIRSSARGVHSSTSTSNSHQHAIVGKLLRLDGRTPADSRPMRMSYVRSHNKSECTVQFGSGTRSVACVRAELVPPPNADRPNDGQVKFNVDVGPMGCMGYEVLDRPISNYGGGDAGDGGQVGSGGGGGGGDVPYAQRLKSNRILRILERTLLIGGAMDAEALCVQSGKWVWRLHVDVTLLDDGGNAIDTCVLAAVAALRHYRLPEVRIGGGPGGEEDENAALDGSGYQETTIIHSDDREPTPLPLHHTPLTATFALFADETGATTSVSALLDPSDREELACDGLLSWSYNKYGEMCCLDFPGGCELRPRQLMSSAKLGKRRCVEICELLETALEEADKKAQLERMERLKSMNVNLQVADMAAPLPSDMDIDSSTLPNEDATDADARKEDEEYRLRALDYSSGHFAASVKEDKDSKKGSTQGENLRGDTCSLFNAILRSAQSSALAMDTSGSADTDKLVVSNVVREQQRKEPAVEIIAHRGKEDASLSQNDTARHPEKTAVTSSLQSLAIDSDEEEEVIQLQTEFSRIQKDSREVISTDSTSLPSSKKIEADSTAMSKTKRGGSDTSPIIAQKRTSSTAESKIKPVNVGDDITDLSQALKKKKKSKKK
ncbi:hypothetical protein ACHAXH_008278 [Discostella pseudostelligera]